MAGGGGMQWQGACVTGGVCQGGVHGMHVPPLRQIL